MRDAVVDADDRSARPGHEVERQLALAAADVEHTLSRRHPLDEEVVVLRKPMLDVDAAVVGDRRAIDEPVRILVDL